MTPLLLALALAAPVPKELRKATSDLGALQGEWLVTEKSHHGKPAAPNGLRYVVDGNKLKINPGDGPDRVVTLTLDEKAKTYTWEASWGTWVGRYKLDGDTFTRISVKKGQPLPDEIAPGPQVEYSRATRGKKADK